MKTALNTIWRTYKQSWKRLWSLRALWIILADSSFYLLLLLIVSAATNAATRLAAGVMPGISPDIAQAFLAKLVVILAVAAIVLWAVWTVTRAIVWQLLAWTRFTPKTWARFFGFNAIWTVIMALPIWLLARRVIATTMPGVMPSSKIFYLHYALIFVLAYFGYNVFYAFVKEQKVFAAYKKGLARSFSDAGYLVPAFIALAATMWLIGLLNPIIARLPGDLGTAVAYLVLFGSLTWAKIYFYDVLDRKAQTPARRVEKPTRAAKGAVREKKTAAKHASKRIKKTARKKAS